jgi:hypothetical protein
VDGVIVDAREHVGEPRALAWRIAVFGEGRVPEAYVPVPSGRIPVEIRQPANSNQQGRPIQVNITAQGNADKSTVVALKRTGFQQAQQMRRIAG